MNPIVEKVTRRIKSRSTERRTAYLERMHAAARKGPNRAHLSCGGQAHAYAAMGEDQHTLAQGRAANIGIITAYNDMLSAHQPFARFPDIIKSAARARGATAQVAGGVPAMCDGITQGEYGMELSLFSRDIIAMSAAIGLTHNTFDAALYLGVCDKIVPGLVIAAATFGHLPAVFLPAGPMPSGLPNDEKSRIRTQFTTGDVTRAELMDCEMASYHSPGTCTFYGTANTNQMLMEFMGLHLPGASFIPPDAPLRDAMTIAGTQRALEITNLGDHFTPVCDILDERAFVNGIIGLMATGGSTNLVLHLPAMARAAGIEITLQDFDDLSQIVPLLTKIYPNGLADINHFHAAGGLALLIRELLDAGLLDPEAKTNTGGGLADYTREPKLINGKIEWQGGPTTSLNDKIIRPFTNPFHPTGGLKQLNGNIGMGIMKISAVDPKHHIVTAPARVFTTQDAVKAAFQAGEFTTDTVIVVRFQGPKSNGMPELHGLTPTLMVLQGRGLNVALVTDGRMSGASGKVPAAIHIAPEAAAGGPIAQIIDGDMIRVDATNGTLQNLAPDCETRPAATNPNDNSHGLGRELFATFRETVGDATSGASVIV
ncbi:MAG: phosphogluconate dehydratase [Rhodobacterales bacterium]|nr:phosphogluconate dehydratase [Rhodobacterales bacterium]